MKQRAGRSTVRESGTLTSLSSTKPTARFTRNTGEIFHYFDSLLLGLTATPREDQVDKNTYELFGLEAGCADRRLRA